MANPIVTIATADVTKLVSLANSGTIWTPAANKIIRVQLVSVTIPGTAIMAAITDLTLLLQDSNGPATIWRWVYAIPAAAVGGGVTLTADYRPGGYKLSLPTSLLQVNFSAALTGGNISFNAIGNEE